MADVRRRRGLAASRPDRRVLAVRVQPRRGGGATASVRSQQGCEMWRLRRVTESPLGSMTASLFPAHNCATCNLVCVIIMLLYIYILHLH